MVCGLVGPLIRSKSSADGGTEEGFEAVVWTDGPLPNRSVTGWEGAELDETGGFPEKELQSPNSPFPLDEAAAGQQEKKKNISSGQLKCNLLKVQYLDTISIVSATGLLFQSLCLG